MYSSEEFKSLRRIPFSCLKLGKHCIGKGVFGKCYSGYFAAHLNVCVKVFRTTGHYDAVFALEAVLTSKLCHPNLPWLYGVTEHHPQKILVLSFHGINGNSVTLFKILHYDPATTELDIASINWKVILLGLVSALKYLHDHSILHNDIKSDNIVVDNCSGIYQSILVDFGKSYFTSSGRMYKLSEQQKKRYSIDHPQIAPDLRDGHCNQSESSDVFSLGRVIKKVNDKYLKISALSSYASLCIQYYCTKRPSSSDLFICLSNMCAS